MKIKSYGKLVSFLRAECDYNGTADLNDVKTFLQDNDWIELTGINVDDLHAKKVIVSFDESDDVEIIENPSDEAEAPATMAADEEAQKSARKVISKASTSIANSNIATGEEVWAKSYRQRAEKGTKNLQGYAPGFSDPYRAALFAASMRKQAFDIARQNGATEALSIYENSGNARSDNELLSKSSRILGKASTLDTGTATDGGGYLRQAEFVPDLINNLTRYGAARELAGISPMREKTALFPRITTEIALGWLTEGGANASADNPVFDQVNVTSAPLGGVKIVTLDILNDALVNVADILADSFANSINNKIDDAYFNGDGTSGFGSFTGLDDATGAGGTVVASGNAFDEVTLSDINSTLSKLAPWARQENLAIACSRAVYYGVFARLQYEAGGNTAASIGDGYLRPSFFGMPVVFSEVMPAAAANNATIAYIGDFRNATKLGMVNGSAEFSVSNDRYFDQFAVGFRSRVRVGINVHDSAGASAVGGISKLVLAGA